MKSPCGFSRPSVSHLPSLPRPHPPPSTSPPDAASYQPSVQAGPLPGWPAARSASGSQLFSESPWTRVRTVPLGAGAGGGAGDFSNGSY